ncbi:MAG: nickel pincer cofactor biosynthesis protein LarB [Victivallales bacterium]|nr:nickel pincer cofactor biosynthesis protein LarB [Victivallales bacterium]
MSNSQVTPDLEREARLGFAEVIYCPGKTDEQLREMAIALFSAHSNVLASRCTPQQAALLQEVDSRVKYHRQARTAYLHEDHTNRGRGVIGVVTAGSTDVAVAEEAAITAEVMGNRVKRVYDVGVAGIHRLLARKDELATCAALVVVAGMEGALPSVVGGLVPCPVIAVPTSVGYGASLNGITALLGMLCSCAPGVTVVNIDNGFGAGYAAARINAIRP